MHTHQTPEGRGVDVRDVRQIDKGCLLIPFADKRLEVEKRPESERSVQPENTNPVRAPGNSFDLKLFHTESLHR
jgi:hypothetical protein